jgi:hypothetical protein
VNYAVVIAGRARRELEAIPSPAFEMIEEKMLSLGDTPRPLGCKKLKAQRQPGESAQVTIGFFIKLTIPEKP